MESRSSLNTCPQTFVDGSICGRPVHTDNLCAMHWSRKRSGRPAMDAMPAPWTKKPTQCTADGCIDPAYARGLCNAHYQRARSGVAFDRPIKRKGAPLSERVPIWLSECSNVDGCLIYPRTNATGYATHVHDDDGRPTSRHRAVYSQVHGAIPKWAQVHHVCGVSTCINPEHLVLATQRENVGEMLARRSYEKRIAHLEALLAEHHCKGCNCNM